VLHARNDLGSHAGGSRGGLSLYVPETWEPGAPPAPLVVALHGGSGHGRDFLWAWLREARSRGALLLSPTALGRTWSIMGGEDVDAPRLRTAVEDVAARYHVDRSRVLLTGMSDGATYALLCGLQDGMPFTHLAPACGVLHPFLLARGDIRRARGRPIYLVHGALDWMFPVQTARMGRDALEMAGARVVYREIEDLSHTYPRDENPRILDWLARG
jgi:phospholipase/carboxylesterase